MQNLESANAPGTQYSHKLRGYCTLLSLSPKIPKEECGRSVTQMGAKVAVVFTRQ